VTCQRSESRQVPLAFRWAFTFPFTRCAKRKLVLAHSFCAVLFLRRFDISEKMDSRSYGCTALIIQNSFPRNVIRLSMPYRISFGRARQTASLPCHWSQLTLAVRESNRNRTIFYLLFRFISFLLFLFIPLFIFIPRFGSIKSCGNRDFHRWGIILICIVRLNYESYIFIEIHSPDIDWVVKRVFIIIIRSTRLRKLIDFTIPEPPFLI